MHDLNGFLSRSVAVVWAALIFVAMAAAGVTPAAAQGEAILDYQSRVVVHKDGALTVTETIRVFAAGHRIKQGIYRDFPTTYKNDLGNRIRVGFKVLKVLRDGRPEPWFTRQENNGVRIYIGRKGVLLPRNREYTYTISYRTTRQIGFFKDFDQLAWNVTGNGWAFTIFRASATVVLPQGATVLRRFAYTGAFGAKGTNWVAGKDADGNATFATTKPLPPRHGLTIAVAWPKGFVVPPSSSEKLGYFLTDNLGPVIGLVGLLIVFFYYFSAWVAVGRDPSKGVIFPRFRPPDGFTPAATRFVTRMKFDNKAFASAILSMAVKGYLSIREKKKKKFTLEVQNSDTSKLSRGERKIANALFKGSSSIDLEQKNHAKIRKAIDGLKESLKTEFEINYFLRNRKHFFIGLGLTVATAIAFLAAGSDDWPALFLGIWLAGWTIGCFFIVKRAWTAWLGGSKLTAIFLTVFAAPFLFGEVAVFTILATEVSPVAAILLVGLGLVNVLFAQLLKAPTREGRRVLDEIDGLKMYMTVAEKDRLDKLHPPEKTPELFEKLLPYALALDVENDWSKQFADVLKTAGTDVAGGKQGWSPAWYHGSSWTRMGAVGFADSLGGSFSSAISSSSTAPGSSSSGGFSSGGGSSGGGGGGGGGGGW